ncbi:MAG TPA: flagellar hook capping FlgD N-terminal domain-containing protein [Verrucomicrobiae bacterium]|nr:flagellar hook capping FlgD N-terminal domain-containing protein [Verrucomicrobiae bacterium]
MSTVPSVTNTSGNGYEASVLPEKTLNQQDFFKLLMAQMTSQDPMNPVSNAEFMGQMAQFSTLEQTRTLEQNIALLRTEQQVLQANTLIGRDVTLQSGDATLEGTVEAVVIAEGVPKLLVDGVAYDLSQVTSISPTMLA